MKLIKFISKFCGVTLKKNKMKVVLVLCALAAVAYGEDIFVDWSSVKPIHQVAGFLDNFPRLRSAVRTYRFLRDRNPSPPQNFIVNGEEAYRGQFPYAVSLTCI